MEKEVTLYCCLCDHTGDCPYYRTKAEPRGTIIAGWTIFSDLRANAAKFGLPHKQLQRLTKICLDYEVKYDDLARKISSLRLKFSETEMTRKEAKSLLRQISSLALKADNLFIDFVYQGREIIPTQIWNNYKKRVKKIAKDKKILG